MSGFVDDATAPPRKSRRRLWGLIIWPVLVAGCSASTPSAESIRAQMMADQLALGEPIVNSIGMTLVPIPPGEFEMGLPEPDDPQKAQHGDQVARPQRTVTITQPFYLSACEVTQSQYEQVTGDRPWAGQPLVEEGANYPATYISWKNAIEFCQRLSEIESVEYRLPTEAEWEYACRSGTTSAFSFGDDLSHLEQCAWFDQNAYKVQEQYPHAVGQKTPNWWGLYDMHGNVWEWCSDWHGPYEASDEPVVDPTGPESGRYHVWRGGSFSESALNLRSASRLSFGRPDYHPEFAAGFRVVRSYGD